MEKEKWFHEMDTKYKVNGKIINRMAFVNKHFKTETVIREYLSMEKNRQTKVFINGKIIVIMRNIKEDFQEIKFMVMVLYIRSMVISLLAILDLKL